MDIDNTDDKYIAAVRAHLGVGCPADRAMLALVDHVNEVMNCWCRIVGMQAGEDMRDFPKVLRRMMGEDKEPTAWVIEHKGHPAVITHYKAVADAQRGMGAAVTPYCSQF